MPVTKLPNVTLSTAKPFTAKADVLILGVRGDNDREGIEQQLDVLGFTGERDQVVSFPAGDLARAGLIVAVALPAEPTAADLRAAAARGIRAIRKQRSVAVALHPASITEAAAVAEGARLGAYRFDTYKSELVKSGSGKPESVKSGSEKSVADESIADRSVTQASDRDGDSDGPREIAVLTPFARQGAATKALQNAVVVTDAVAQARDWVNTPPVDLRPAFFADAISEFAGGDVKVAIWDEKRLARESCGGILGVGLGSEAPPRLVTLTYAPRGAKTHLALVGKGITFDSGGLSIKTGAGMKTMKIDMAGAATVVAATVAIARLGLPIKVTAHACLAENMPSGSATRPGDVLTMRNGSTVEVHNTDAEGRLVLGDGLALAAEAAPDHIVDVATLTGACMVALGERTTGVMGNDDDFVDAVASASRSSGELMWPLPITEEIAAAVRTSKVADLLQHNPKPYGGALFAAAFLREFVSDVSWAHLDIAGPSFNDGSPYGEVPTGGTGVAVRTLVQLAEDLSS